MQTKESEIKRTTSVVRRSASDCQALLRAPFPPHTIQCRPLTVFQGRDGQTMGIAGWYVDARIVQERLDAVLGADGWYDNYEAFFEKKMISCKLSCRLGEEWVTKCDVGAESEQPDEGDRHKASFSDALKRAAVKFGVGRYLYYLPASFFPYNKERKRFDPEPVMPREYWPIPGMTDEGKDAKVSAEWRDMFIVKMAAAKDNGALEAVVSEIKDETKRAIYQDDMIKIRVAYKEYQDMMRRSR